MNPLTDALLWLEARADSAMAAVIGCGIGLFAGFTIGWLLFK